ncbi:MAG: flagellar protein FlaG [Bacillota bacterium]
MKINPVSQSTVNLQEARSVQTLENGDVTEAVKKVETDKRNDVKIDEPISEQMLENSIKQANKTLEQFNKMIERTVHEKTHTIMYVLKDTVTKEVIREFPPKKIQDMIAKMWEMAGILVDERR